MSNENEEEMFQPRDYQSRLIEIAARQNTIIYLPTGAGKTFIAVMVLRRLGQPLKKPLSQGGKISVMLVNTVALVDQQSQYIRRFTHFGVGGYSGELNVDGWKEEMWKDEFDKHQVLVMTSQIFLNIVESNYLSLRDVNLLIFDECHRGVNDHAMRQIMKNFGEFQNELPRVIGLTATLLNRNCNSLLALSEVESLETTFHSKTATVDELKSVIGFATNPKEDVRTFGAYEPISADCSAIQLLTNLIATLFPFQSNSAPISPPKTTLKLLEPEKGLEDLSNLIKDTIAHIKTFGTYGGKLAIIVHIVQLERIKKHCQDTKLASVLDYVITEFIFALKLLSDEMKQYTEKEQIYKFSSRQMHTLFEILKEYKNTSERPLCGIIFVKKRFSAKVLFNVLLRLKTVDPEYEFLSPNFIVGFNNNPFSDTRESLYNTKMNKKVLNEFRNHKINLLVSTNVLEEGVDIPMCTLVVKYDKPDDYRAYIQSKGRARHQDSFYYVMVDSSELDRFRSRYLMFQEIENVLNQYLVGQNDIREAPSFEQVQELYDENEIPPYYVNGPGSAQVTSVSAISLICRYCASLPADKYTNYTPTWFVERIETEQLYKVVIQFPRVCPLWETAIEGQYMQTKKLAKRAAALKACELLHKTGELDDNLLPVSQNILEDDRYNFFNHWPINKESDVGHQKKQRIHYKKVAHFCQGVIQEGDTVYLHIINLTPLFTPKDNTQRMLYEVYASDLCFGIVSAHPLPKLCKFSVFISMGEIEVDLNVNVKPFTFTKEEVIQLRTFHYVIFKDVLEILKNFLIFDNNANTEGFLVVPIKKREYEIDFDLIINNKQLIDQKNEPNDQEKIRITVTEETYLGKIVTPWYRTIDKQYLVIGVCTDLNAFSKFPSDDFDTYASYFNEKYHTNILNPKQPLLRVKGLSKRLNCLRPRHLLSKRNKEKCYEEMEEHLIPELCIKQEFPSELWIQATLLPSILHRLINILQAEELRKTIAFESGLGVVELETNEYWKPLVIDNHLLKIREPSKLKPQKREEDEPCVVIDLPKSAMRQLIQDFDSKKLESEFPWQEKDEPVDIERRLDVTLMDIQYYENFISQKVTYAERLQKHTVFNKREYPAITYDQTFIQKDISLLKSVKIDRGPELVEIFRALSSAKCNDVVNFERLESLGDSFLKMSMSLLIFLKYPKYSEGKSTTLKGQLVSNKNLYYIGVMKKLTGYLRNSDFEPKSDWKPPAFSVPDYLSMKISEKQMLPTSLFNFIFSREEQINGNLKNQEEFDESEEADQGAYDSMITFLDQQIISDKTVADGVEALIGAYFESCGFVGGLKLLEWLKIVPESENIENLLTRELPNPILTNIVNFDVDVHIPSWGEIEKRLGYHFNNRAYLLQALTHSSYTPNRITSSYQTLEFLGDAILDFLITCHIYEVCKDLNPGQLTDLRSALVNNITFAGFTVRCGFHKFLLFSNNVLLNYIDNFVEFQESKNYVIDDEVLILLEENDLYLSEHVDVPKVLGDVFEALAGAVFLDSGMNLETVWNVFYHIMWKEIEAFRQNVPKNAVRLLYETVGAHPEYLKSVTIDNRTMMTLEFMLDGVKKKVYGFGENKPLAKKAAAKIALNLLRN